MSLPQSRSEGWNGVWWIPCRDERHAAGEAARAVLDAVVADGPRGFGLALSGGRIAPVFFGELVRQNQGRGAGLAEVDFFWADERCVPPEHPESNFGVARPALLEPLEVLPRRVHRLAGERVPTAGADRANSDWQAWLEERSTGKRGLNCVVLGVGEDGHVASLFPGNLSDDLVRADGFHAVRGPKPPPDRLTMGYEMLWQADRVVVLAPGPGKWEILSDSLEGRLDTPLARVVRGREDRPTVVIGSGLPPS